MDKLQQLREARGVLGRALREREMAIVARQDAEKELDRAISHVKATSDRVTKARQQVREIEEQQ